MTAVGGPSVTDLTALAEVRVGAVTTDRTETGDLAWCDSFTKVIPRVARKQRVCGVGVPAYCEGNGIIRPGEPYVEWTEYPGGDAGYADAAGHPVRMAECRSCAARYGRDVLFKEDDRA